MVGQLLGFSLSCGVGIIWFGLRLDFRVRLGLSLLLVICGFCGYGCVLGLGAQYYGSVGFWCLW